MLDWIQGKKAKLATDTPQGPNGELFPPVITPDLNKKPQELQQLEEFLGQKSSQEKGYSEELVKTSREMVLIVTWCSF